MTLTPHRGTLKTWKGDRGFGFIKPDVGDQDVFLHISALRPALRPPHVGDTITYTPFLQSDGRLRAMNATIEGVPLLPVAKGTVSPQATSHQEPKRQQRNNRILEAIALTGFLTIGATVVWFLERLPTAKTVLNEGGSTITSAINPSCLIKGNISLNSGRKYYHMPGMEDYEITRIDPARGERWFCTEADAQANGWTKAPTR